MNAGIEIVEDSLPAQIDRHGRELASNIAFRDGNQSIDWQHFSNDVNKVANRLLSLSLGRGSRICILGRNSIDYCKVISGVLTSGACFIPLP